MTNKKRTIRPSPVAFGARDVFEADVRVATFHFLRTVRDRAGRREVTTVGALTYTDGRIVDLGGYGWYKDIVRDICDGVI